MFLPLQEETRLDSSPFKGEAGRGMRYLTSLPLQWQYKTPVFCLTKLPQTGNYQS
jgi:hypothetical protein